MLEEINKFNLELATPAKRLAAEVIHRAVIDVDCPLEASSIVEFIDALTWLRCPSEDLRRYCETIDLNYRAVNTIYQNKFKQVTRRWNMFDRPIYPPKLLKDTNTRAFILKLPVSSVRLIHNHTKANLLDILPHEDGIKVNDLHIKNLNAETWNYLFRLKLNLNSNYYITPRFASNGAFIMLSNFILYNIIAKGIKVEDNRSGNKIKVIDNNLFFNNVKVIEDFNALKNEIMNRYYDHSDPIPHMAEFNTWHWNFSGNLLDYKDYYSKVF